MWLLPGFSPLARAALRGFYHFQTEGVSLPRTGPVLLVANHPNSLLDPAAVVAVAGRPVRFLAKAPLFTDPLVGWLVRGAGAIPVHRPQDDPSRVAQNADTFRSARNAIQAGDVVGIFPEGLSHSEPSLAPLRTGAARLALGAAAASGDPFPIIPVGLLFESKQRFRSPALAVVGDPVDWGDLAGLAEANVDAVRELTRRIGEGLREVTLNVERRSDARVVVAAEQIFNAERGIRLSERERLRALREVSMGLARLRAADRPDWIPIARAVTAHARRLNALALQPHQLAQPEPRIAGGWLARQSAALGALLLPGVLGMVAYWIPFRITDFVAHRFAPGPDTEATYKLLVGIVAHFAWTCALCLLVAVAAGPLVALAMAAALPACGWLGVRLHDRWREARAAAGRFLVRDRREAEIVQLRARQAELAARLGELRESASA